MAQSLAVYTALPKDPSSVPVPGGSGVSTLQGAFTCTHPHRDRHIHIGKKIKQIHKIVFKRLWDFVSSFAGRELEGSCLCEA